MAVCCSKKCKSLILAGQQSIPCHSCDSIFHAKCLDYSGLVRDAIDMRSGLRYYCEECIAYETQAISIRRLTKSTVTELIRNSRRNTDLLVGLESQLTSRMLSEPDSPKPAAPSGALLATARLSAISDNMDVANSNSAPNAATATHSSPVRINCGPIISGVAPRIYAPLVGVAPKRFIFVSRLNPGASENDGKTHLSSKLNISGTEITVSKFNFKQRREISSFKIGISDALIDKVLDIAIWPEHAIVHEYVNK
ncbi:hypothetical protein KR084_006879, partial [Drosophila pseudotakahashii]